ELHLRGHARGASKDRNQERERTPELPTFHDSRIPSAESRDATAGRTARAGNSGRTSQACGVGSIAISLIARCDSLTRHRHGFGLPSHGVDAGYSHAQRHLRCLLSRDESAANVGRRTFVHRAGFLAAIVRGLVPAPGHLHEGEPSMSRRILRLACACAVASGLAAAQIIGPSTTTTPYLVPNASLAPGDVVTVSLLTTGDSVGGYRLVGIPDGLGAFANAGGITLLANHELGQTQGIV